MHQHLSYLQSVVIALLQGVTELFPVSSLGHAVLVPAWIGGSWTDLAKGYTTGESEGSVYLTFIVALHVATAIALLVYFRRDWVRIISGFFRVVRTRRVSDPDERLAMLLVVGTVPVGITGLALEHALRTLFAKPLASAVFLTVNGLILLGAERLRRRAAVASVAATHGGSSAGDTADGGPSRDLQTLSYREAGVIGLFQTLALLAGISRAGITLVGGLLRGLDHEDAARFAFLLATPVIAAAGLYKLPTLFGDTGRGIGGQVLLGMVLAGAASYVAVAFLERYFRTRTLTPFGIYCLVAGVASIVRFA